MKNIHTKFQLSWTNLVQSVRAYPWRNSIRSSYQTLMLILAGVAGFTALQADKLQVRVTVQNLMPENGSLVTPPWVGFHDGQFDVFDSGSAASESLERIAEDGNAAGINADFDMEAGEGQQAVLNSLGPIPPGMQVSKDFFIEKGDPNQSYLSYAAMLIPSNDAFIGNGNPAAYSIFDEQGNFVGLDIMITRDAVYDAGVEVNDEIPENTPALGQMTPNTGEDESGVIRVHPGHLPKGSGGIVDREAFALADFTELDEALVRIQVYVVEPAPVDVTLSVENRAPENGVYLTPVWFGLHDGSIQIFQEGEAASAGLERIAEDGDPAALNAWFDAQAGAGGHYLLTSTMSPPVFSPGTSNDLTVSLNANDPRHQYLSFVSMVIPSNDAFIANVEMIDLFDDQGNLNTQDLSVMGLSVWDAGTEVNSEIPEATPLLGQMVPDTGDNENGVVHPHEGFMEPGMGGILDQDMFANADFRQPDYPLFHLAVRPALNISSMEWTEDGLRIEWNGGRAPFQVQSKLNASDPEWTNVGEATDATSVLVPLDQPQSFFRILEVAAPAEPEMATYRVTFQATWSAATHPTQFPGNPHFSGLIGATHNDQVQFWQPGGMSSPGIQNMAETGGKSPLQSEIQQAISMGTTATLISGGGIGRSPGSVSVTFTTPATHPLLSLVSMIAPSPDWFVGVHGLSLRENDQWVDSMTIDLLPYDAGTDDGSTYTSPNAASSPHQPISRLEGMPFLNQANLAPLGTFQIVRTE